MSSLCETLTYFNNCYTSEYGFYQPAPDLSLTPQPQANFQPQAAQQAPFNPPTPGTPQFQQQPQPFIQTQAQDGQFQVPGAAAVAQTAAQQAAFGK